jgi:hypothetical protein
MPDSSITPKRYSLAIPKGIPPGNKIRPNAIHLFADRSLAKESSSIGANLGHTSFTDPGKIADLLLFHEKEAFGRVDEASAIAKAIEEYQIMRRSRPRRGGMPALSLVEAIGKATVRAIDGARQGRAGGIAGKVFGSPLTCR